MIYLIHFSQRGSKAFTPCLKLFCFSNLRAEERSTVPSAKTSDRMVLFSACYKSRSCTPCMFSHQKGACIWRMDGHCDKFIVNVCSIARRFFWMHAICCRIICFRGAVMELVSRIFLSDNRFSQTLLLKHFARPFFLPWPLKICSRCLGSISFYSATAKECLQTLSALKLGHRHDTWLAWTAHSTLPCLAEFEATSNLFWLFMKCHSNEFPETLNTKPIMQALSCVFCCGKNVIAFFDSLNIFALR